MGRIRRLDEATINRIAAGEVVERPASVVKELVENALDAGARRIRISVEEGGIRAVRVVDDGCGMAPEEVPLALERHATSKLRAASELWTVRTLGFRGEALPAIAAVSRFAVLTREPAAPAGTRVRVVGGRASEPEPAAAPPGTTVVVEDLFYNTPARRKALKSPRAEAAAVAQAVGWLALAHPGAAVSLELDGRPALRTPGTGSLRDAVAAVFGPEDARAMVAVDHRVGHLAVHGLTGLPTLHRASRARQVFIVNGRAVDAPDLADALEAEYATRLLAGRHPLAVLRVDAPPGSVDVNVHPAKRHVRFVDAATVRAVLGEAVLRALDERAAPPTRPEVLAGPTSGTPAGAYPTHSGGAPIVHPAVREAGAALEQVAFDALRPAPGHPDVVSGGEHRRKPPDPALELGLPGEELDGPGGVALPPLEPLGQLHNSYLVAAGPDGLYVIDQHAIAERLEYEAALEREGRGDPLEQPLLVPFPMEFPPAERAGFETVRSDLEALGFQFEDFGPGTVLVRAVPLGFGDGAGAALVRDVVDQALAALAPGGRSGSPNPPARREHLRRILAACRAAITANRPLTPDEQRALLHRMAAARQPFRCLHGRPTVLRLSAGALAHRFARR